MKKTIVCVFAHPDDEAFGPGGTIHKFAKENDVYILCATKGEAGQHHEEGFNKDRLFMVREEELLQSAKVLGVKKVYFLDFKDGTLCNNLYHTLAEKIESLLKELQPEMLLTYEPRGISGHIDHITISMVTTYVFKRLKFIKSLWYYCLSEQLRGTISDYFIYFPPGYKKTEIAKTIDISDVWEKKVEAMHCHDSQKKDIERILARFNDTDLPREENFMIMEK